MAVSRTHSRRVLLAIPYSRDALQGIVDFLGPRHHWEHDFNEAAASYLPSKSFADVPANGVIIQALARQPLEALADDGRPAVSISDGGWDNLIPAVHLDNHAIGRLAAEYFLDRGYKSMLVYGHFAPAYGWQRRDGFLETCQTAGDVRVATLDPVPSGSMDAYVEYIHEVVAPLPKPLAVFGTAYRHASWMVRYCAHANQRVPEDLAILSADNDEVYCNLDHIPLSAVRSDMHQVGMEAAALLGKLMDGGKAPQSPKLIPPLGIITRLSTNILAIDDESVRTAMRFIRQHHADRISIEDVATDAGVSRRTLDRLFSEKLGKTPAQLLMDTRLRAARRALRETQLTMPDVAKLAGFTDQNHLGRCFRRELDTSPQDYRRNFSVDR